MKNKRILVLGAQGQLGREFVSYFQSNKYHFFAPDESKSDITNDASLQSLFYEYKPQIVINCAAYNKVDIAEDNHDLVYKVNRDGPKRLALLCKQFSAFLVHYSSDYLFDGKKTGPYTEKDSPNPINIYGQSKLAGEDAVKCIFDDYLIFRLSWVIGRGQQNFLYKLEQWSKNNSSLKIVDDEISVPTFTSSVVDLTIKALEKQMTGLYNMCSSGYCSRFELAKEYFKILGNDVELIPAKLSDFNTKARRPGFSAMSNALLQDSLDVCIADWKNLLKDYLRGN